MPLKSGRPGRSEFSHGKGRYVDPKSDYQSYRGGVPGILAVGVGQDKRDLLLVREAELALDATNPYEATEDMYYAKGNPDTGYVRPALIQEPIQTPSGIHPAPVYRYGVERQE